MSSGKIYRLKRLADGFAFNPVSKVFVIAFVLDMIYELIVLRLVYPGEALLITSLLALGLYLLIRGPVSWIAQPCFAADESPKNRDLMPDTKVLRQGGRTHAGSFTSVDFSCMNCQF